MCVWGGGGGGGGVHVHRHGWPTSVRGLEASFPARLFPSLCTYTMQKAGEPGNEASSGCMGACVDARERGAKKYHQVRSLDGFEEEGICTFSTVLRLLQLRHTWSARKTKHKLYHGNLKIHNNISNDVEICSLLIWNRDAIFHVVNLVMEGAYLLEL